MLDFGNQSDGDGQLSDPLPVVDSLHDIIIIPVYIKRQTKTHDPTVTHMRVNFQLIHTKDALSKCTAFI